ncbi:MAG TPA: efflux RND transporter periplasmic adaptor subunit [Anaerovoracaceae bacterium]|nr:efflux RND transporter periplasmic adaptor subunit [Anaerovoracaceae bacterium]
MINKNIKIFITILVVSMIIVLPACSSNNDQVKVKTSIARTGQLETTFPVAGALLPVKGADLTASFMGKVTDVFVTVGDAVKQGQILAKLDNSQLNAQYQQAVSSYLQLERSQVQASIAYNSASETLARTKILYAEGAVAKVQLDGDQKAFDIAKSQVDSGSSIAAAKSSMDSIGSQMNNADIKSPFDGVVLSKNISVGENASMGSTLFSVGDMSLLKLTGTVSQAALPYIKNGLAVDLFIDIYPDRTFTGSIDNIGAMSVSTGSYFPVEISLKNNEKLAAGLSAHAEIKIKGEMHIIVPNTAIVKNKGENYLFVIENGKAMKKTVITGIANENDIEILKGLNGKETVAITNANNLFDDMPVQIVKD